MVIFQDDGSNSFKSLQLALSFHVSTLSNHANQHRQALKARRADYIDVSDSLFAVFLRYLEAKRFAERELLMFWLSILILLQLKRQGKARNKSGRKPIRQLELLNEAPVVDGARVAII